MTSFQLSRSRFRIPIRVHRSRWGRWPPRARRWTCDRAPKLLVETVRDPAGTRRGPTKCWSTPDISGSGPAYGIISSLRPGIRIFLRHRLVRRPDRSGCGCPLAVAVGIDPSPASLDNAAAHGPSTCALHPAQAQNLPFADASSDSLVSSLTFRHIVTGHRFGAIGSGFNTYTAHVVEPTGRNRGCQAGSKSSSWWTVGPCKSAC